MPIVLQSGNLILLEPSRPVQASNGIALCVCVCVCVCVYVCVCIYVYIYTHTHTPLRCVCVCVCIYIYIYIYIHTTMFNIKKFYVLPTESIYLFIWYLEQERLFLYIACLLRVMKELFGFNSSVSFHHCSMLKFIYMLLLRKGQMRTVKKQCFFRKAGLLDSNV